VQHADVLPTTLVLGDAVALEAADLDLVDDQRACRSARPIPSPAIAGRAHEPVAPLVRSVPARMPALGSAAGRARATNLAENRSSDRCGPRRRARAARARRHRRRAAAFECRRRRS
jgi:hypothetical protein